MEFATHTEAVQALFVKNMGAIRGIIIGMVSDLQIAEDILQEVFITVSRRADQFEIGTNFMAWVRTVARLKVLEHVRQQKKLPFLLSEETLEALVASAPVADDGWDRRQKALYECLQALPPRAHRIITLRFEQGLLPARIAELVAWSVGAVRVQLTRSCKILADCVQRKIAKGAI